MKLQNGSWQMDKQLNVAHVIVNNLGGITSLVQNLILYKGENALPQDLYLLDIEGNMNAKANHLIDPRLKYEKLYFNPKSNWYHSYKKISNTLSEKSGLLISNDQFDLILLQVFNVPRKVVQLVHDEYNLSLSIKFQHCIDCFISHNKFIFEKLCFNLPDRKNDIHFLNYGIPTQSNYSRNYNSRLKLLFLGRHDKQKGIFDLFEIEKILQNNNVQVDWTILGKGPESEALKLQWANNDNVKFSLAKNNSEVLKIASENDILVFPTRFEGSPVALLEAMSVGCVPIVTALDGGIKETIDDKVNGFLCGEGCIDEFAENVILLSKNRETLMNMKQNAFNTITKYFDPFTNFKLYHQLFIELINDGKIPVHHSVNQKIGSRLDSKYIPSWVTSNLRNI
jgi:glycosyltransferase involved in cell wall biosynthesis